MLSKGMSNIYLKVTNENKLTYSGAPIHEDIIEF